MSAKTEEKIEEGNLFVNTLHLVIQNKVTLSHLLHNAGTGGIARGIEPIF